MPKGFILSLVIAGVAAIPLAIMSDQRPFDELVERADIAEQAKLSVMRFTRCGKDRSRSGNSAASRANRSV
jgi:hypothetical protein